MEAYKKMKIEYNRLFDKLKSEGIKQKDFRDNASISGATMQKLLHGESVTTETICKICDYFQCMPDEIMEFIPDSNYIEKQQAKQEVQQQIAELQAKLYTLLERYYYANNRRNASVNDRGKRIFKGRYKQNLRTRTAVQK